MSPLARYSGAPGSPLGRPPSDLAGFPARDFPAGHALFRIHHRARALWWFSHDRSGRFDLSEPRGTCYLAEEPLGAFVEVFRTTVLVPDVEVSARRLSVLRQDRPLVLANCTSRCVRAFGVTAAIHAGQDYELSQAWAETFADAGFDGVRYLLSHDPAQRSAGIALFGSAGLADWPAAETDPIGADLIRTARRSFGIQVLPTPPPRSR